MYEARKMQRRKFPQQLSKGCRGIKSLEMKRNSYWNILFFIVCFRLNSNNLCKYPRSSFGRSSAPERRRISSINSCERNRSSCCGTICSPTPNCPLPPALRPNGSRVARFCDPKYLALVGGFLQ